MPVQPVFLDIARKVCVNFLEKGKASRRHDLVVEFEVTQPISEMDSSGLLRSNDLREEYLPSAGTFAVLPQTDELHQKAKHAFVSIVPLLRQCFIRDGQGVSYQSIAFEAETAKLNPAPGTETVRLGLYLAQHFAIFAIVGVSENKIDVISFGISESIINLKDPNSVWDARARSAQSAIAREPVPIESLHTAVYGNLSQYDNTTNEFGDDFFWSLMHPSIVPEAISRYRTGFYADAVLAALKVITHQIRRRTGLDLDGAQLMNKVFAPNQPLLQFDGSGTETARNLQQGYLQIFAGTMMAVRNPKAHGFEQIDATRCIHFLFLASLLAYKLEEARDVAESGSSRNSDGNAI
jgi:uncharacterized protein (TIGR02391 family)